jgi:hypothetical protein
MIDISCGFKQVRFTWRFRANLLRKLKIITIFGRKFYGRNHDLVDRYGIYASQTLTGPFLVHDLSTYTR